MKKLIILSCLFLSAAILILTGCSSLLDNSELGNADFVWHYIGESGEPAFLNGWYNKKEGYDLCAYGMDSTGFVYLKGVAQCTYYDGSKLPAFILPEGNRQGKPMFLSFFTAAVMGSVTYMSGQTEK